MTVAAFDPYALKARVLRESHGFLSPADVAQLAAHPDARLWPLLIRFNACRCTAPAQDVAAFIAALEAAGDWCRDVSFPAESSRSLTASERALVDTVRHGFSGDVDSAAEWMTDAQRVAQLADRLSRT